MQYLIIHFHTQNSRGHAKGFVQKIDNSNTRSQKFSPALFGFKELNCK
jgi:hypothetical protein